MQYKNTIAMAGMRGMYRLYVCYLEHRRWTCVGSIVHYFQWVHRGRGIALLNVCICTLSKLITFLIVIVIFAQQNVITYMYNHIFIAQYFK